MGGRCPGAPKADVHTSRFTQVKIRGAGDARWSDARDTCGCRYISARKGQRQTGRTIPIVSVGRRFIATLRHHIVRGATHVPMLASGLIDAHGMQVERRVQHETEAEQPNVEPRCHSTPFGYVSRTSHPLRNQPRNSMGFKWKTSLNRVLILRVASGDGRGGSIHVRPGSRDGTVRILYLRMMHCMSSP